MATETQQDKITSIGKSLFETKQKASWSLWVIGGIPIVLTFFQAIFVALDTPAVEVPVVGTIASFLRSYNFLNEVAIIFYNSSTLIILLFVVITGAWFGQGYALKTDKDRSIVYGLASLSSVFYFLLFWGVYWPLSPFTATQGSLAPRLIFFAIPVLSSVSVLASARLHPDLANEIASILAEAEEELDSHQTEFKVEISDRIGSNTLGILDNEELSRVQDPDMDEDLDTYISVDCDSERDILESHKNKMADIRNEIQSVGNYEDPSERVLKDAKQVKAKVTQLPRPSDNIKSVESSLRKKVKNNIEAVLRSELKDFKSFYQESYDIQNLPTELQSVDLDHINGQTTLTNSPNYLGDKLENKECDIILVIKDTQNVIRQIDEVNSTLAKEKKALTHMEYSIKKSLSVVEDQIQRVDGRESNIIEKLFIDGNIAGEEILNVSDIKTLISEAYDHHYDCQFNKQARSLIDARQKAHILVNLVEFVATISNAAASSTDVREFTLPSYKGVPDPILSNNVIQTLSNEFQSLFGASLEYNSQSIKIIPSNVDVSDKDEDSDDNNSGISKSDISSNSERNSSSTDNQIQIEEEITKGMIFDGVNTLLNHAETKAGELDRPKEVGEQTLTIKPDSLPALATESEVLANFRKVLLEDSNIESVETNKQGSQCLITITATNSDISIVESIKSVKQEFNNE